MICSFEAEIGIPAKESDDMRIFTGYPFMNKYLYY